MHEVFGRSGTLVGSIDESGIIRDRRGKRAGALNPYTRQVRDAAGAVAGRVHEDGYLYGLKGELLGTVAEHGGEVRDGFGNRVGTIARDGSLPVAQDLQHRGAAALLLLCRPAPPARDLRALIALWQADRLPAYFLQRVALWSLIALFALVLLFGVQLVAFLRGRGDPVAVLGGLGVTAVFVWLLIREVKAFMR